MIYKERTKPQHLLRLEALSKRMSLKAEYRQYLEYLLKGYEGETEYDKWLRAALKIPYLLLNDLSLEVNRQSFQIDSLLLTGNRICLYELKSYRGDYLYQKGCLYTKNGKEINNPTIRLNEKVSLLRQFLQQHQVPFEVTGFVVFIHPQFTLYQAEPAAPYLFRSQIPAHFSKMNSQNIPLNEEHRLVAEKLKSLHAVRHSFSNHLPEYNFADLKKDFLCSGCGAPFQEIGYQSCSCHTCGNKESVSAAIFKHAEELRILFPEEPLTTKRVYDWCGQRISNQRIREALKKNYETSGEKKGTTYRWKESRAK